MIKAKIWNRLSKNDKMYSLVGLDHNGKTIFRSFNKQRLYRFVDLVNKRPETMRQITVEDLSIYPELY